MKESTKKQILAVATLSGTIIGVGIFSLPYITVQVGLGIMLVYLSLLTALVFLIHLFFSEVALKTPDFLRLPGYAGFHLGKWGKRTAILSAIFGSFGALLAYIIIGGGFLANLLMPILGGTEFIYLVLYFCFGAFFIFWGIKAIAKIEFWGMILFFLSLIVVFWKGLGFFGIEKLNFKIGEISTLFLPYGPILFALWGATMIPEVEEMLSNDKKMIKKTVFAGTLIPAVCYLFFILLVVAISGSATSKEAILGLKSILGQGAINIMFIAGFLATFTSFITIGLTLKKVFCYDLKIPHFSSWVLSSCVPFLLYFLGLRDFIKIISLVGGAMLAIDGILIILMYRKISKSKMKVLVLPLILIFIAGIIYEITYFIR